MPLAEFQSEYPDAKVDSFNVNRNESPNFLEGWWDGENVTVAEYWWVENQQTRFAYYSDGKKLDLSKVDDETRETAEKDAKRVRTINKKVIKSRLMSGSEFLSEEVVWPGRRIPIFTVPGEEIAIGDRTIRFGLVRGLKDTQRS
jgi:hypothetical protein